MIFQTEGSAPKAPKYGPFATFTGPQTNFCDSLLHPDLTTPHDHRVDLPLWAQLIEQSLPREELRQQEAAHRNELQHEKVRQWPIWRPFYIMLLSIKSEPNDTLKRVPDVPESGAGLRLPQYYAFSYTIEAENNFLAWHVYRHALTGPHIHYPGLDWMTTEELAVHMS